MDKRTDAGNDNTPGSAWNAEGLKKKEQPHDKLRANKISCDLSLAHCGLVTP